MPTSSSSYDTAISKDLLSLDVTRSLKFDFTHANSTLHNVVATKNGCRQLSRALRDSCQWSGTPLITFYNDGPHDFYFTEPRSDDTRDLCGGMILQEDRNRGKYYTVHT